MKTNTEIEKDFYDIYNKLDDKKSILYVLRAEKYKYIKEYFDNKYTVLKDKKYSFGMKLYWFLNGLTDFPKCKECGKPNTTHRCYLTGYYTDFCSQKCAHGHITVEKTKNTNIEKYGVDNPGKVDFVKEKRKNTNLKKYGCENVYQNEEIKKKCREIKLEKYGDENYVNSSKRDETNIKKYGCVNPFGNKEIQKKIRQTNLEKYGVEVPSQSDVIKEKISVKTHSYNIHNSYTNYLLINPYSEPNFTEDFYLKHSSKTFEYEFKCRRCGHIFTSRVHNGNIRRCPKCYPSITTSSKEQEIFDFIKSIYKGQIIRKDRTILGSKEIDIYLPTEKLAIEFDGLYWHSELNGIDKNYHLNKTIKCENKGIQLIHIFEDEWEKKQAIVKERIRNMLGIYDKVIYARKCDVKEMNNSDVMDFIETNHLQGFVKSSVSIGLFYKNELVSVMTFCKPRIALGKNKKGYEWELLRFCSKQGYHVVGAAGKLLKHFERTYKPKTILTYADRRWSVGKLYYALGFDKTHNSKPNYWYLNNGCSERYHRFKFRKSELKKILKIYDESKTEHENMLMNKYTRIYDCGNIVYVKKYS